MNPFSSKNKTTTTNKKRRGALNLVCQLIRYTYRSNAEELYCMGFMHFWHNDLYKEFFSTILPEIVETFKCDATMTGINYAGFTSTVYDMTDVICYTLNSSYLITSNFFYEAIHLMTRYELNFKRSVQVGHTRIHFFLFKYEILWLRTAFKWINKQKFLSLLSHFDQFFLNILENLQKN